MANSFESIDFKNGLVRHIDTDFSFENRHEDMLQVVYPEDYLLDAGWYGEQNEFLVYVIKNNDWENPIVRAQADLSGLRDAVISAIDEIEALLANTDGKQKQTGGPQ